jgi:putative spermidine/putrescine transport system ATP-binding protein
VRILLRPEDLRLTAPGAGRLAARVEACAFFGATHEIRVATALGPLRIVQPGPAAPGTAAGIDWPDRAGIAYAEGGPHA